jgi:RHH-type proline utilization regulon transcriptional repressor/proline dehydrogenase/delta 1-pyrroline-5-carboxylate dehydrogenase
MAAHRGRTIAVMAHETGKTVHEGDPEVSEAIDFARWASVSTRSIDELVVDGVATEPVGTVLVAGPWNFPYAIPANGVLSALAAGNTVLLKPAPESVATAVELVDQLHEAGIPREVVQLVHCPDDDVGRHLITHPGIDTVVLTGAYATARMFLDWKPSLRLIAETSGKNAIVITGAADVDLAIKDLVRSAFGHAGQKCSAASLAIVEASLYDDHRFLARLADAVRSLRVGPAPDLATMVGPIIRLASGPLERALTQLDEGERWLVPPEQLDADGLLWRPAVRIGVRPGSWFHLTECFGPVLGVLRAEDLDHAIALQNTPEYGLTGGLHSLDPDELARWLDRVQVGNAYVNRHITGAIVRRQPFGGWKHSAIGRGAKTGGPGDVLRFVRHAPRTASLDAATASYEHWWRTLYGVERDDTGLAAESNVLRHRPVGKVVVRPAAATTALELELLRRAAHQTGAGIDIVRADEPEASLAARLGSLGADRLRLLAPAGDELRRAAHAAAVTIDDTPVTGHGRVELPCWLREQAVSITRHRHGRISPPT